jgi:hypothetical protein
MTFAGYRSYLVELIDIRILIHLFLGWRYGIVFRST